MARSRACLAQSVNFSSCFLYCQKIPYLRIDCVYECQKVELQDVSKSHNRAQPKIQI